MHSYLCYHKPKTSRHPDSTTTSTVTTTTTTLLIGNYLETAGVSVPHNQKLLGTNDTVKFLLMCVGSRRKCRAAQGDLRATSRDGESTGAAGGGSVAALLLAVGCSTGDDWAVWGGADGAVLLHQCA
eukprot:COSAG05_NODE_105_length_18793_cov_115.346421_17_plen_127_part_00